MSQSDDKNERAWIKFVRIMVDGNEIDVPGPYDGDWPRAAVRMPWKRWSELDSYVRSLCRALDAHENGLVMRSAVLPPNVEAMRAALQKIARWHNEFPTALDRDGKPCSYGLAYGSNGERDYMRQVALDALAAPSPERFNAAPPVSGNGAGAAEADSPEFHGLESATSVQVPVACPAGAAPYNEPPHKETDLCGFDRDASHSNDTYVCTCGWPYSGPSFETRSSEGASSDAVADVFRAAGELTFALGAANLGGQFARLARALDEKIEKAKSMQSAIAPSKPDAEDRELLAESMRDAADDARDAARYRWLRAPSRGVYWLSRTHGIIRGVYEGEYLYGEDLDAAVDAGLDSRSESK